MRENRPNLLDSSRSIDSASVHSGNPIDATMTQRSPRASVSGVSVLSLLLLLLPCIGFIAIGMAGADQGKGSVPHRAPAARSGGSVPVVASIASSTPAETIAPGSRPGREGLRGAYPLQFETNAGQTDPRASFLARGPGYTLFLSPLESNLVM